MLDIGGMVLRGVGDECDQNTLHMHEILRKVIKYYIALQRKVL